ncbi:MAG: DUF4397 domain-containing protein [Flavipsychrobacter sp.]
MRRVIVAFLSFALLSTAACKKKDTTPSNSASVMFVNGTAGADNVDATSNGTKVQSASNLAFLKGSGYQSVTAGSQTIAFQLTSLGTPLKTATANFTAGSHYSVFAGGIITSPTIVVTTDDLTAPPSGNAKIRFINLSNDSLSETANLGTTAFATGITTQSYSSFTNVAAGTYTIKAGDPANISTVVSATQQVDAGKIYTVVLTGTLSGSGTSGLTLTVFQNN